MAGPYYTTEAAIENAPNLGDRIARGGTLFGNLLMVDVVYPLVGTEAATELIRICRNRPELKLIDYLSRVQAENPGTALVIDIGDAANTDKYADGLTLSSGGSVLLSSAPGVQAQDPEWTADDDTSAQGDWIYATVMTATSLNAAAELRFQLVFATNT